MRKLLLMVLMVAVSQPPTGAQDKKVSVTFTPENTRFADAAEEYRRIWADEGDRMIDALEQVSGLKFPESKTKAVIFEGPQQKRRVAIRCMLHGLGDRRRNQEH